MGKSMHQFWSIQLWNGANQDGFYSLPTFCLLKPTRDTVIIQTVLPTFCLNLQGRAAFSSPLWEAPCTLLAEKRTLHVSSSGSFVPSGDSPIHTYSTVALGCGFNSLTLSSKAEFESKQKVVCFQGTKSSNFNYSCWYVQPLFKDSWKITKNIYISSFKYFILAQEREHTVHISQPKGSSSKLNIGWTKCIVPGVPFELFQSCILEEENKEKKKTSYVLPMWLKLSPFCTFFCLCG